jgi:DNA-binding response OmpR family regulator
MSKGTVLIVEDNKDLVQLLEYNLAQKQYTSLAALDGLTACRMIEEEKPDLILLIENCNFDQRKKPAELIM